MHLCFTTVYHSEIEILVKLTMLKHRPFPSHTFPFRKIGLCQGKWTLYYQHSFNREITHTLESPPEKSAPFPSLTVSIFQGRLDKNIVLMTSSQPSISYTDSVLLFERGEIFTQSDEYLSPVWKEVVLIRLDFERATPAVTWICFLFFFKYLIRKTYCHILLSRKTTEGYLQVLVAYGTSI